MTNSDGNSMQVQMNHAEASGNPPFLAQRKETQGYHMLQQPIPSIVVNPLNSDSDSVYFSQHTLPAPDKSNVVLNPPIPQRMPFANSYVNYPVQNTAPVAYYPNQMYPQYREDSRYFRPAFDRAYSPMVKTPDVFIPPMHGVPVAPMPVPVEHSRKDVKTNFKPTHTKKNSRPKINKIVSDSYFSKSTRKKVVLGEYSLDSLFTCFLEVLNIDTARADITEVHEFSIESELELELFDLFVNNFACCIDVFLPQERFQKIIPELALYDETRMILDSIFCLSSLMLLRMRPDAIDQSYPLKYYQRSVKSIRYHLSLPDIDDNGILARCLISTNLLCIYELFFVAIDSTYVKGAGSILLSILSKRNRSESLLKNPFYETCFWAMFVCDLVLSLKFDSPSMYSLDRLWKTMDPEFFDEYENYSLYLEDPASKGKELDLFLSSLLMTKQTTNWWQHKVMMLFCSITEFSNLYEVVTREDYETNKQFSQWLQLNRRLEEFEQHLPVPMKPIIQKPSTKDRVFPLIYFKDEHTAIVGLNYKLAKISLHVTLCTKLKVQDKSLVDEEMAKYPDNYRVKLARDVVGVMQTYDSNLQIWPVNVHALRQAAKHIGDDPVAHEELMKLTHKVDRVCHLQLHIVIP